MGKSRLVGIWGLAQDDRDQQTQRQTLKPDLMTSAQGPQDPHFSEENVRAKVGLLMGGGY